jgi:hypothetical protein
MSGWTSGSGGFIPPGNGLYDPSYHGAEAVVTGTTAGGTAWFPQFFGNTAGGTSFGGPCTRALLVGTTGGYLRVDFDGGPTGCTIFGLTVSQQPYRFSVTKVYGDSTCTGVLALY